MIEFMKKLVMKLSPSLDIGERLRLEQPSEEVWPIISDVAGHAAWREGVDPVDRLPDRERHEA